jgi:uncharacterized protein YoxC
MINIPLFKEQIEQKLQSENHDMYWLANKVNIDHHVLLMLLSRKSMKNASPMIKKLSEVMDIEIPKTEDEPSMRVLEPVPEPVLEEKPTLIYDMSEPLAEINEPEIWLGGRKYTKEDILKMTAESVEDHRKIVELTDELDKVKEELAGYEYDYKDLSDKHEMLEYDYNTKVNQHQTALAEIEKLNKELQELTDKYIERDKEAIRLQVQVNTLSEDIEELKQDDPISLENMSIGEAIQQYRALSRLFTDEVLK